MASIERSASATGARRKSSKMSLRITFKLAPSKLQQFVDSSTVKAESTASSTPPNTAPVEESPNAGPSSDSQSSVTVVDGASTSQPSTTLMPPPSEGLKKRGTKRAGGAASTPDGLPKPRGKPGPKKKARMDDGHLDSSGTALKPATGTLHKLGPRANQGAINAGLRALDRGGKPCRKWTKGSFKLKSFTGITWEITRWKAPPKITVDDKPVDSLTSEGSSKENKDHSQVESEKSNGGQDIEMVNSTAPSQMASSPAPSNPSQPPPDISEVGPVSASSPLVTTTA